MNSQKKSLRQKLKKDRLSLTSDEISLKSNLIQSQLRDVVDWSKFTNVHIFEPIKSLNEVAVSQPANNLKYFCSRKLNGKWVITKLGDGASLPSQFDAVIVPMLGFDNKLHRIGYGGGYYDKFLADQPSAIKIGVCFNQGEIDNVPIEPHDIPLDIIVTEDKVYRR